MTTRDSRKILLSVDDLHVAYGKAEVIHGVSFAVHEGEFVAMLGRNGAGKSTILHAVSGSIAEIYRYAVPIGVLAVILSLTLPEVKLRTSLHPIADEIPMSNADPLV